MIELSLIGIGTGDPRHLTLQAIDAMQAADLILIPLKGAEKDDLAGLRRRICDEHCLADCRVVEFPLPRRDTGHPDYRQGVEDWHDAIASVWNDLLRRHLPDGGKLALLIWGDPMLYDSTIRIANRLAAHVDLSMKVIPGITAIQALCAAHAITLNRIGAPVHITTGRRLRDQGWPENGDTVVVMLDGACAFSTLGNQKNLHIWWGAFVGMPEQILIEGPLERTAPLIEDTRARARARHGWIMDIYLLRQR